MSRHFVPSFIHVIAFPVALPLLLTMNIVSVHLSLNFPMSIKRHEIIFN